MAKKKRRIPAELKERWARNQRDLAVRIADLERRITAQTRGETPRAQ